ncbi:MAG: UvrD-helicase domain-containing protein [Gammaproteobacteria bacterium]
MSALVAADPTRSASVLASAGTGKTWLLVTRTVRLLLAGAEPGGILAVTFTNRAAGEMLVRLRERCEAFAIASDLELDIQLREIAVSPCDASRARARALYDLLLTTPWPPRIMTFHAFCQDLLARFPLEAGVAPGFELLANERELQDAAWDALVADCARGGDVADALAWLAAEAGSLDGARRWLRHFMMQRADWWAWTDGADDPLAFALDECRRATGHESDTGDDLFMPRLRSRVGRLCALVGKAPSHHIKESLTALTTLLADPGATVVDLCAALPDFLFTKTGNERRKALANKAAMVAHGDEIEALHGELAETLSDWALAALNRRWFTAGDALLAHYQRLKAEARVLDFGDLEWRACRLLTGSDSAHWIQYRLDQRIDHLLVDEFQDTSPTQWRMLRPLLDEIAAGDAGRARSAFIVGDEKQSIYGFRRADPRLLGTASALLTERLGAAPVTLEGSRRSASAVMDFVNAVFGFTHDTHHPARAGRVEWLEVPDAERAEPVPRDGLRDPLTTPRSPGEELRGIAEARIVAARIKALVEQRTVVDGEHGPRTAGWDDIMVLVRKRTRLPALELELRRHGIPYASDSRGMLLERPEIGDLMALLEFLAAPWHNLRLARLLKSPLFGCSDGELLLFAPEDPDRTTHTDWFGRLIELAGADCPPSLARAARLLGGWRALADSVPVHDLLDQIFAEADVLTRYAAASPAHQAASVRANLLQFLDLALDADAGRYPTLHRLVERLERTREADAREREFDDAPVDSNDGRVRVMTIHAAKGLEAPIVFVVQTDLEGGRGDGVRAWVDWPPAADRPTQILFARERGHDTVLRALRERVAGLESAESQNLLYVALTRARQYLFVSGSGGDSGWYPALRAVFATRDFAPFQSGTAGRPGQADTLVDTPVPKSLTCAIQALPPAPPTRAALDPDAVQHGVLVHAALEHLHLGETAMRAALLRISGLPPSDALVERALQAAVRVHTHPDCGWLFDAGRPQQTWNEARLSAGGDYGVIDRLVVTSDEVWIVDYKTDRGGVVRPEHRAQLARYIVLARALWPTHRVRAALLFTGLPRFEEIAGL